MLRALYTSATGATTQQFNIDVIANNVANVNTTAFKRVRAEFQDVMSQTLSAAGALGDQGTTDPIAVQVGLGSKVAATQKVFLPGSVVQTGNPLDLSIQGEGFFQVQLDSGEIAYTRDGSLKRDASGQLVTSDGYLIQPNITLPQDTTEIVVNNNGIISVRTAGNTDLQQLGQMQLVKFANNAGLENLGNNLYGATPASGQPIEGTAGQGDFARTVLAQGSLENSNVQIVEELIGLISAQRAFEANSKVMRAGDEVLQMINNVV